MLEVKTISVSIDRDWHDVYNAIWRPEAFQSWASGLAKSALENCGDHWKARGPEGSVKIRFTGHNQFGVMDHYVRLSSGEESMYRCEYFKMVPEPRWHSRCFDNRACRSRNLKPT